MAEQPATRKGTEIQVTRYYIHNHVPHVFAPVGNIGREVCLLCGQRKGATDIHTIESITPKARPYAGRKPDLEYHDKNDR